MTTVPPDAGRTRRRRRGGAAVAALLIVLTSCSTPAPSPAPPSAPPSPADPPPVDTQLAGLTVVPRPGADPTYRRAAFGPAWADVDGNSCRQRTDALYRDVDRGEPYRLQTRGGCPHDMLAGTWTDPYTGTRLVLTDLKDIVQAQSIPVDHRVSLLNAWQHGASGWTDEQRLIFANDLDNLQPTTAQSNGSKGGKDAAAWRPRRAGQCGFATSYVEVKARYVLSVDQPEKNALVDMLTTC